MGANNQSSTQMLKKGAHHTFWSCWPYISVSSHGFQTDEENGGKPLQTQIRIVVTTDSAAYGFIRTADIYPLVSPFEDRLLGRPLHEINTRELEQVVRRYPPVAGAETYTTADGTLCVEVRQRIPILRVINRFQESFFLDSEGKTSHPSTLRTPARTGTSGYIDENAREQESSPPCSAGTYNRNHPFWNARYNRLRKRTAATETDSPCINHTILWGPPGDDDDKIERLESCTDRPEHPVAGILTAPSCSVPEPVCLHAQGYSDNSHCTTKRI
jgi:cell division protein FtsQ